MTDMAVELTELEKLEVTRVDAVLRPANGFPVLLMKGVAKGQRDCPKCDKSYDADHQGGKCENCGTDLPDAPASKAADDAVDCPTCKGDGKIMDDKRDCPDCGAKGQVTPAKAKTLAAKSLPDWHADAVALVKKAMVRGKVDESQDIDGGNQAIALLGKLIGYEAAELAAGNLGEVSDIGLLADAAGLLRAWVSGESAVRDGNVMPATALMQSEAVKADLSTKDLNDLPDSAFAHIEDGGTKDSEGKTTPRTLRHFAIHDKAHADNAAARIAQGAKFGDQAKAKVTAAQKKFGEDTAKSQIAEGETSVDTVTQETGGQIAKAVAEAVTKAVAPLQERIESLGGELAKVKATPVPGGPMMSAAPRQKAQDGENWAAKAVYYRQMADSVSQDPAAADGYRQLARQAEDKAKQTV
jgi:DNA-directed RNA polymerase subunit RPC12/RpoP